MIESSSLSIVALKGPVMVCTSLWGCLFLLEGGLKLLTIGGRSMSLRL